MLPDRPRPGLARVRRRRHVLWLASLVMLPMLATQSQAQQAAAPLFERLGSLPRVADDVLPVLRENLSEYQYDQVVSGEDKEAGTALLVAEARQIWQFYDTGRLQVVAVRDADSLRLRRTMVLPGFFQEAWRTSPGLLHVVDAGRRVFLYRRGINQAPDAVVEVDTRDFSVREYAVPIIPQSTVGGLEYDPLDDSVLLIQQTPTQVGTALQVSLIRVDLGTGSVSRPRTVRTCESGLSSADQFGAASQNLLYATESFVFLHCLRTGNVSTIVRVPRAEALSDTSVEDFTTGPTNGHTAIVDAPTGRVFNTTDQGAIWVFDTSSMAYVGTVAAHPDAGARNPKLSYGVDDGTGRLYFLAPEYGLGVVDGRLFPVPQGRSDSRLAAESVAPMLTDPLTKRLFVLPADADAYIVYRQPAPVSAPPSASVDGGTVDRAEEPGVTESSFSAAASGYGTRVLMTKGVIPLFPMPGLGGGPVNPGYVFTENLTTPCSFSDRDLFVGRVAKTEADTGSTAAAAIAADVDGRTKLDLEQPSRCDANLNSSSGNAVVSNIFGTVPGGKDALDGQVGSRARWTRAPAACSSSTGEDPKTATPDEGGSPPLGTSSVQCAVPDGKNAVMARAEGNLSGQAVSVGRSASWTEIRREPRGIVSTAYAVASDIEIGGLIRIAEVRSMATSVANGRPAEGPMSQYVTFIRGVTVGDTVVCAAECDARQVTDALNVVAAGRVQFRVGTGAADQELQAGSPGGALTAVQKSPQRRFSDRALAGDDTSEVPGLEMVRYNDNFPWGAARQVFQFAGVATSANYNILLLPEGSAGAGGSVGDVGGGTAGEAGTAGGPGTSGTAGTDGTPGSGSASASLVGASPSGTSSGGGGIGGVVGGVLEALGRGLRLVFGDPRQALLLFTAWLLLVQPAVLARRRALLHRVHAA